MNFYKHFIGDYQRKTSRLSMLEHGAYRLMLDEFYATQEPLPLDRSELYNAVRAIGKPERAAVDKVLQKYWRETPEGFVNDRAQEEILKADEKASHSRENGLRGGRPKKNLEQKPEETQQVISGVPKNNLSHSHSQNQKKATPKDSATPPRGFVEFWDVYPRKVNRTAAERAWKKLGHVNGLLPTILKAVSEQTRGGPLDPIRGEFVPYPASWINARRWEDVSLVAQSTDYDEVARLAGMVLEGEAA